MSAGKPDTKVDFAYLLKKYGPKKKRPPPPEPKYYDHGFSIQFKLSHAYKALEKQEHDASKARIKPKSKLSRRALKALIASNAPVNQDDENSNYQPIDRGSIHDRVNADLDKFKEIGRKKREEINKVQEQRHLEEEKANQSIGSLHGEKVKIRTASFWRHLMNGNSISSLPDHHSEFDNTFLTNADPDTMLLNMKHSNRKHRKTRSKSKSPGTSPTRGKREQSPRHIPKRQSAVVEWEKRRIKRKQRKSEQNIKIKQAIISKECRKLETINGAKQHSKQSYKQMSQKSSGGQAKSTSSDCREKSKHSVEFSQTSLPKSSKISTRPQSAPVRIKSDVALPVSSSADEQSSKEITESRPNSKGHSSWAKNLRSNLLHQKEENDEKQPESPSALISSRPKRIPRPQSARVVIPRDGITSGDDQEGEDAEKNKLVHKPTKFLFDMCRCQKVSKPKTLNKLQRIKKVGGVIELYGCSGDINEELCPFCSVLPRKRIQAWIEDVEYQTGNFNSNL